MSILKKISRTSIFHISRLINKHRFQYIFFRKFFFFRRIVNVIQYIFDRTFLQKAYVIVNYEKFNFFVNQAKFENDNLKQIIAINHSIFVDNSNSKNIKLNSFRSLNFEAITRIILDAITILIVTILIVTITLVFFLRRQHKTSSSFVQKSEIINIEINDNINILQFAFVEFDASIFLNKSSRFEIEKSRFTNEWKRFIKMNEAINYELS